MIRRWTRFARNTGRYVWQRRWILLTRPLILTLRVRARHRRLSPGVTILMANWQTGSFLEGSIEQTLRLSPDDTRIVVVDNASSKEDRVVLDSLPSAVRVLRLPANVGHGVALDLAAMFASTEFIVALDVDAFPIDQSWIERLERPLRSGRTVSGAGGSLGQIAPCCLMMSLDRFVRRGHTFTSRFVPGNEPWLRPSQVWDVGRSISLREGAGSLHRFERTGYLDPVRSVGEIFDDLIYHNGYATIERAPANRGTVTKADALATWHLALERFGAASS